MVYVTNNWWGTTVLSSIKVSNNIPLSNTVVPYKLFGAFNIEEGEDVTAPNIPTWSSASISGNSNVMTWSDESGTGAVRYTVYRSAVSNNATNFTRATRLTNVTANNYTDIPPAAGVYFYYITALDDAAMTNESWYSTQHRFVYNGDIFAYDVAAGPTVESNLWLSDAENDRELIGFKIESRTLDRNLIRSITLHLEYTNGASDANFSNPQLYWDIDTNGIIDVTDQIISATAVLSSSKLIFSNISGFELTNNMTNWFIVTIDHDANMEDGDGIKAVLSNNGLQYSSVLATDSTNGHINTIIGSNHIIERFGYFQIEYTNTVEAGIWYTNLVLKAMRSNINEPVRSYNGSVILDSIQSNSSVTTGPLDWTNISGAGLLTNYIGTTN